MSAVSLALPLFTYHQLCIRAQGINPMICMVIALRKHCDEIPPTYNGNQDRREMYAWLLALQGQKATGVQYLKSDALLVHK